MIACLFMATLWTLDGRKSRLFEIEGDARTFSLVSSGEISAGSYDQDAPARTIDYVISEDISIIFASNGDSIPKLSVLDPGLRLHWIDVQSELSGSQNIALFEGTYSAERYKTSRGLPGFIGHRNVVGVITAPEGAENLQFVEVFDGKFGLGDYVLSGASESDIKVLAGLASEQGFSVEASNGLSAIRYLLASPLVVGSALFLLAAVVCTFIGAFVHMHTRSSAISLLLMFGARPVRIAQVLVHRAASSAVVGAALGGLLVQITIVHIGQEPLNPSETAVVVSAALLGTGITAAVWGSTIQIIARSRDQDQDAE